MQSERLTPREWLAAQPLEDGERLYAVFSRVSETNPLIAWFQQGPNALPHPLWQGTPYAGWQEVMPFLGELSADSAFLDWLDEVGSVDWGWLAVSRAEPMRIFEHLRSLTKVRMPGGSEVFFRYWDGRYLLSILSLLGPEASTLLPMFGRYLIDGRTLQASECAIPAEQSFPWWTPSAALLSGLKDHDLGPLTDNLLQWLQEEHPDLCDRLPEASLRLKIAHFARRGGDVITLQCALLERLAQELS